MLQLHNVSHAFTHSDTHAKMCTDKEHICALQSEDQMRCSYTFSKCFKLALSHVPAMQICISSEDPNRRASHLIMT